MRNMDPTKKQEVNPGAFKGLAASYKTFTVLLIYTAKFGKSLDSDRNNIIKLMPVK